MPGLLGAIARGRDAPLYQQLRKAIEQEVAAGNFDPAAPLPSSRELARQLGISRNTANSAYQELIAQGLIDSQPRRGLFVNARMLAAARVTVAPEARGAVNWDRHLRQAPDHGIPEIAKVTDWHRYEYPFVAGQVEAATFPRLAWARCLREALEPPHLHYSLRDGIDEDDPLLLEMLCKHVLPSRGLDVDPSQVLITSGSQQGLDLLASTVLRPGDRVGFEDPGYLDARHILIRAGAVLVPRAIDSQGLIPGGSTEAMRLLYLTPSHQSPTNVTLSIERRRTLLAHAAQSDSLIVEDDYDSEFRYQGSPTLALKALPGGERVIYLGTFSKFLAPGLRIGYLVGEPELVSELRRQRRYRVRHTSGQLQRAMALLIDSGHYGRTVGRRRTNLKRKWETLRDSLEQELGWGLRPPPGGVSIWVQAPPWLDAAALAERALAAGIVIERGDVYFARPDDNLNYFRMGFSAIALEAIEPGVVALARVIADLRVTSR